MHADRAPAWPDEEASNERRRSRPTERARQKKMTSDARFVRQLDDIYEGLKIQEEQAAKEQADAEIQRELGELELGPGRCDIVSLGPRSAHRTCVSTTNQVISTRREGPREHSLCFHIARLRSRADPRRMRRRLYHHRALGRIRCRIRGSPRRPDPNCWVDWHIIVSSRVRRVCGRPSPPRKLLHGEIQPVPRARKDSR